MTYNIEQAREEYSRVADETVALRDKRVRNLLS